MPDPYIARAEEFNRLLPMQGTATRSMRYGWRPTDEQRAAIDERAARLNELAELICPHIGEANPPEYVNKRIASWMKANPLTLTTKFVADIIEQVGVNASVTVQIGEPGKGGYFYQCHADDLITQNGQVRLSVPESVAEHFRQQGRRQIQRELADLLALKSHH